MADRPDTNQMQASMAHLLGKASKCLALYLEKVLPPLFNDWWNEAVVNILSFQQRRRVKDRGINSLTSLDLAALLRVLDQNWYQISTKLDLTSEARHFVKEMQTVRNRWAHAGSEGFPVDDVYRDLDTLQRFAVVVEANESLLDELRETKASLLSKDRPGPDQDDAVESPSPKAPGSDTEFTPGQIVYLKSNPATRGAVVSSIPGKPENRFLVFMDGETHTYYASQLKAEDQPEDESRFLPCDEFHSYLTALQIRYPGLSTLYSLNAARVDFIPYQFRPVLRFIRSDRPRLLVADGVGVGKTIEAGLILRELQARRDIRSILIICPRPLVTERKWQIEMKRFEERFVHLDGPTLRYCINEMDLEGLWPEQHQRIIIPYSLFDEALLYGSDGRRKRKKGLLDLDPPPRFDLVIVDEAHHIRNQDTFSHKAVRFFCDHAEAVIFLTATPIQLGNHDLFVLLHTLRPDLIIDQESFEHMSEPNPFINQAVALARAQEPEWAIQAKEALYNAAGTPWGQSILKHNPEFNRINVRLAEGQIGLEERVQLITELEALHTFSGIINRTHRRDIGEFTVRKPETVIVEFTPNQKDLHDELLQIQAEIFSRLHGDVNVKFMMTTIRRQAASCLFGLAPFLEEILSRHLDELSWEEADNTEFVPKSDAVDSIESRIQAILGKACDLDPYDPKLDALRNIIRDKQKLPNNKVMLFSSFRHTLHYLYEHLKADGFRVGLIHGGTPDEDRVELRNRFELPPNQDNGLDVLLFSEIGCEGLDYQFCDCIVNYDLPWNPMRVEQRIGRIDRNGQKSESVAIFNLITPGTVDADIYERCLVRIGVFNNALGGSEEILGEITREIRSIAENFSLNEIERGEQLQQLADNKIRLIQEQDELEQKQLELFGMALTQTIYPERERRRALYHTGLPPRDGSVLVERLSDIKSILQEAVDYAAWSTRERMRHFERLIETTSQIEAFGVRDLNIGRSRIPWADVLAWWMAPDSAERSPTPNSVSRWYDFASKHFIYGLNWAIGSIIGSILERDGGEGQLLERWEHCALPWSVMWYKDMVSWGTLDPIASYALTRKEAFTRPVASDIAAQYWEAVDEISDTALEPKRVAEWMRGREQARPAVEEDRSLPHSEIAVALTEDFSEHTGTQFRVLPAVSGQRIDWYDPAGFLLARSDVPDKWHGLKTTETDFVLDPSSSIVTWQHYV